MDDTLTELHSLSEKGRKSDVDFNRFQSFVEKLDFDEVKALMSSRLDFSDCHSVMTAFFHGLNEKKKVKLIEHIITELQGKEMPQRNVDTAVARVLVELDNLSIPNLVKICDLCVSHVSTSKSPSRTCWKEVIPKILQVLSLKSSVDYYGSEMTSEEYKKQVISSIFSATWSSCILSPLASMFKSITLQSADHEKVVHKLCSMFDDMEPNEIPPLVHQVLQLTETDHALTLFFALKRYFDKYKYKMNETTTAMDSTRMDDSDRIEEETKKDLPETENMVLYHIEDAAKTSQSCVSQLIKCARGSVTSPEVFIDPFLLTVLLGISSISSYEEKVQDIIRLSIIRVVEEEERRKNSEWLRSILSTRCNVERVISLIIQSRTFEQVSIFEGLIGLSLALLRTPVGKVRESVASKVWFFGRMIVVNLIRRHDHVASYLLRSITDSILSKPDVAQYTDCLAELCETSPLHIIENPTVLATLHEMLPSLPEKTGHKITSALISLMKMSSRTRDNLILTLRKLLFQSKEGTRKVTLVGLLQILKRFKLNGMLSMSQSTLQIYSCPSLFTQACLDVHQQPSSSANNDGLCFEVIGFLKRCFILQLSIKICLYNGLNQAIGHNTELCSPVGAMLLEHFMGFYMQDREVLPPLNFAKCVVEHNSEITVQESLGHLLFIMQQVAVAGSRLLASLDDEADEEVVSKQANLDEVLSSLVKRFSQCQLKHFDMSEDAKPDEIEGTVKGHILRQTLQVYQALLAYMINSWDTSSTKEHAKTFLSIFKTYFTFADFAKSVKSGKKKDGRPGASTQAKKHEFSLPEIVWNLEIPCKLLELLICDSVGWCLDEVAEDVRGRRPLHRFALQCSLEVVLRNQKEMKEYKSKTVFKDATELAALIFHRCMSRFDEYKEYDLISAVSGVEVFTEIFLLVSTSFKKELPHFLAEACEAPKSRGLDEQLECLLKFYLKTLVKAMERDESEEEGEMDQEEKKLISVLFRGVQLISDHLPVTGGCVSKVLRTLNELAQKKFPQSLLNVKTLFTLLLSLQVKAKSDNSLHENLSMVLCKHFGTINEAEMEESPVNYEAINDSNKVAILPLLCSALSGRIDAVEWMINRIKAELSLATEPNAMLFTPETRRSDLKRKEKELVQELGMIVSSVQWVATIAVPSGPLCETVCRLLHHTYCALTSLTKYFFMRSSHYNPCYQEARFAKLVRLSASHLSSQVADFLLYIETADVEERTNKISARKLKQAEKQTVYIPRLVGELENFTKTVTKLSVKCKDPSLTNNMKLTVTRDFKLNTKRLEEILKRSRESEDDEEGKSNDEDENVSQNGKTPTSRPPSKTKGNKGTKRRKLKKNS